MTINFPEWFLQALSVAMVIHAVANLIHSYYEGKLKRMKSAMMGMEMAVRMGEVEPDQLLKSMKNMVDQHNEKT